MPKFHNLSFNFLVISVCNDIDKMEKRTLKIKTLIQSLETEDLESLISKMKEEGIQENPLLIAAEFGSYKILKSIVELGAQGIERLKTLNFTFEDCNKIDENVLHLGKLNLNNFYDPSYKHVRFRQMNLFILRFM